MSAPGLARTLGLNIHHHSESLLGDMVNITFLISGIFSLGIGVYESVDDAGSIVLGKLAIYDKSKEEKLALTAQYVTRERVTGVTSPYRGDGYVVDSYIVHNPYEEGVGKQYKVYRKNDPLPEGVLPTTTEQWRYIPSTSLVLKNLGSKNSFVFFMTLSTVGVPVVVSSYFCASDPSMGYQ
ncbi:hypothetical protein [Cysteiniphilum marinum]|nr:hypothetical protein [Cysteiniphilum marinum]